MNQVFVSGMLLYFVWFILRRVYFCTHDWEMEDHDDLHGKHVYHCSKCAGRKEVSYSE